jgi:hypothetical protein
MYDSSIQETSTKFEFATESRCLEVKKNIKIELSERKSAAAGGGSSTRGTTRKRRTTIPQIPQIPQTILQTHNVPNA